jgi:hypothetical protein
MNFFHNVFGKKQALKEQLTPLEYIQTHKPGKEALQDVLHLVQLWMDASSPAGADSNLTQFMDSFAKKWNVTWKKGKADEVFAWFKQCALRDYHKKDEHYTFYGIDGLYGKYVKGPYHEYGLIYLEKADWWKDYNVEGCALEVGVCGAFHILGKVSAKEFLYLAHQ